MNLAQTMLARGVAVLSQNGPQAERVTFGTVTADAVCDRRQSAPPLAGVIDVTAQVGRVIWWPLDALPYPTQGKTLTDADGATLSVKRAYHISHSIELVCSVNEA